MELRDWANTGRLQGVVIGALVGFTTDGSPVVVYPGNRADGAIRARTTAILSGADLGRKVALLFEDGDPARPIVIGRLLRAAEPDSIKDEPPTAPAVEVVRDGERLELTAEREIILRCGKASIVLTRAGKVLIRGAYVSSHSTGAYHIRGGSVNIN
jgi:hypothetical protein